MAKRIGPWATLHSAIEASAATSAVVDCTGYGALLLKVTLSAAKNWTLAILGSASTDGPFVPVHSDAVLLSWQTNASGMHSISNVPNYVMVKATEDEDGATLTVLAAPMQV